MNAAFNIFIYINHTRKVHMEIFIDLHNYLIMSVIFFFWSVIQNNIRIYIIYYTKTIVQTFLKTLNYFSFRMTMSGIKFEILHTKN